MWENYLHPNPISCICNHGQVKNKTQESLIAQVVIYGEIKKNKQKEPDK